MRQQEAGVCQGGRRRKERERGRREEGGGEGERIHMIFESYHDRPVDHAMCYGQYKHDGVWLARFGAFRR
jgi:hypothetical protein